MNRDRRLFIGCVVAMSTIAFGLVSRTFLIGEWSETFGLSQTQIEALQEAGVYPFALGIIFWSLVIDRVGYGRTVVGAWVGQVTSAIITLTATGYAQLYVGTLIFALANGALEAAINPMAVALYPRSKTHHLNLLHAGWPAGWILGGLMAIGLGLDWKWKIGLFLAPAMTYAVMMLGHRFPPQERVMAGVSHRKMLEELGWAGCLVVSFFAARALHEILRVFGTGLSTTAISMMTLVPTLAYIAAVTRSFGRPLFVFLLLLMVLLSTTELSPESWVTSLITPAFQHLGSAAAEGLLIYTAALTLIPRLSAGPVVQRLTSLGLLAAASAAAAAGLLGLSHAGGSTVAIFVMATLYGVGTSFFWPTTLGVVSEQFPKGGALTLNTMSGVGMIAAAVLGNPLLDTLQSHNLNIAFRQKSPALYASIAGPPREKYGITFQPLDKQHIAQLPAAQQALVNEVSQKSYRATLADIAVLPVAMLVSYLGLLLYFRRKGGYRPVQLTATTDEPPLNAAARTPV